jgi:hypothetical protein
MVRGWPRRHSRLEARAEAAQRRRGVLANERLFMLLRGYEGRHVLRRAHVA